MSVQASDLLALAGTLASGVCEAEWRCAVSRGYYAAFHACGDWHNALPMPGSNSGLGGGMHQELINRLRNPDTSVPQAKRQLSFVLAAQLEALRFQRVQSDYHLAETVDAVVAANAHASSAQILSKL